MPSVEEIDFNALKEINTLKIVLVDHNNIFDESLETECLLEIIDHHAKCKNEFGRNVTVTINTVGSCATLVLKRIWEQDSTFGVCII